MSLFRVYVDGALFYHPQMSKLAITDARIEEDAENIDSMTLSAPFNHPYLSSIRPLASTIICKKGDAVVFERRALDNGTDFYNTHTWTCESCLVYLKDSVQPPYRASCGREGGKMVYIILQRQVRIAGITAFPVRRSGYFLNTSQLWEKGQGIPMISTG